MEDFEIITMDDEDDAVVQDEGDSLMGGRPHVSRDGERGAHASARSYGGSDPVECTKLSTYVGSLTDMMRNMDMQDVFRYWSALRDWLSDVPRLAQEMSYGLPPGISGMIGARGPPMTPDQQRALDDFVEANVGVPYTHEEHWDMLAKLWTLSFPEADGHSGQLPEQHDQQWKRLGFQGTDPATDFRAAGTLSVKGLLYFAEVVSPHKPSPCSCIAPRAPATLHGRPFPCMLSSALLQDLQGNLFSVY